MKYCYKCGYPMEDDMLFCQRCGTKAVERPVQDETIQPYVTVHPYSEQRFTQSIEENTDVISNTTGVHNRAQQTRSSANTLRKGMKIWMIVCIVFAGLYALIGTAVGEVGMAVGMGGFFAILAAMFFVLAKSPKGNPFIFGKQTGLKKSVFVLICIIAAFVVLSVGAGIMSSTASQEKKDSNTSNASVDAQEKDDALPNQTAGASGSTSNTTAATLTDIQKWYEDQMPAVGQALSEYSQSVDGISNLNVNSSRFFFGGDWNDCYYKFTFTCKVNGVDHSGEARAFLKYQDDVVHWFSFEVFGNDTMQSVVELYDDSYDQIIEDYYKELESLYN